MTEIKTLGILTSGGDCSGLNAVLRAVVEHATRTYGWRVLGLKRSHLGLLEDPPAIVELSKGDGAVDLLRSGGTVLGTTTLGDPFQCRMPDGTIQDRSDQVIAAVNALDIDGLVVIGGDGSMRLFDRLCHQGGLRWIGVPKTIDNDVSCTDFTVGFFTAVDVVAGALDRLASVAASHRRIMVLEVMGRDSGFLALYGGVAGGADVILIPEVNYDIDDLTSHVLQITKGRPNPVLVVVAEGISLPPTLRPSTEGDDGVGTVIAAELKARTGIDSRCTVLGHLQRGGAPSAFDRLLATSFGVRAVDLLASQASDRLVAWRNGTAVDVPMSDVVHGPRRVPPDSLLLDTAAAMGIYVGDRD